MIAFKVFVEVFILIHTFGGLAIIALDRKTKKKNVLKGGDLQQLINKYNRSVNQEFDIFNT